VRDPGRDAGRESAGHDRHGSGFPLGPRPEDRSSAPG
jgi:hypothetical protein